MFSGSNLPRSPKHSDFLTPNVRESTACLEFLLYLNTNLKNYNSNFKLKQPFEEILHLKDIVAGVAVEDSHSLGYDIHVSFPLSVILVTINRQSPGLEQPPPDLGLDPDGGEEGDGPLEEHAEEIFAQKVPVQPISDGLQSWNETLSSRWIDFTAEIN